jgi:ribosomal protein S17E
MEVILCARSIINKYHRIIASDFELHRQQVVAVA